MLGPKVVQHPVSVSRPGGVVDERLPGSLGTISRDEERRTRLGVVGGPLGGSGSSGSWTVSTNTSPYRSYRSGCTSVYEQ